MATTSAIARPYAQAAFQFAQAKQEIPAWQTMLHTVAAIIQDPALSKLLINTRILPQQWFTLLSDILNPYLDENRKNFIRLLTENKRLSALPAIAALFKELVSINNKVAEVSVTTAIPLDSKQQQKMADKLTTYFKQHVTLHCDVDANILGGAIVRAGDKVIDGSIRSQLTRLLEFAIR